jgi:hypothetical protein
MNTKGAVDGRDWKVLGQSRVSRENHGDGTVRSQAVTVRDAMSLVNGCLIVRVGSNGRPRTKNPDRQVATFLQRGESALTATDATYDAIIVAGESEVSSVGRCIFLVLGVQDITYSTFAALFVKLEASDVAVCQSRL